MGEACFFFSDVTGSGCRLKVVSGFSWCSNSKGFELLWVFISFRLFISAGAKIPIAGTGDRKCSIFFVWLVVRDRNATSRYYSLTLLAMRNAFSWRNILFRGKRQRQYSGEFRMRFIWKRKLPRRRRLLCFTLLAILIYIFYQIVISFNDENIEFDRQWTCEELKARDRLAELVSIWCDAFQREVATNIVNSITLMIDNRNVARFQI